MKDLFTTIVVCKNVGESHKQNVDERNWTRNNCILYDSMYRSIKPGETSLLAKVRRRLACGYVGQ